LAFKKNTESKKVHTDICILCKRNVGSSPIIYGNSIRGDKHNECSIVKCSNCNHIQLLGFRENLKMHYDNDEQSNDIIKTFNITITDIINKEKVEIERRKAYLNLKSDVDTQILDVGAGYCSFAKHIINDNPNVNITCLEPSKSRTGSGVEINNIIDSDNIRIFNSYLDENFCTSNNNKFDIITAWHVLEHLDEYTVDNFLKNMYSCCRVGGKIFIEVPNSNDELLRLDNYKKINYMIHHLSYWNENTLKILCENNKIHNYEFKYVQRYGFRNYLNWIYDLGEKQDLDMNDDKKNLLWLHSKQKAKNTDAIMLVIHKE
jgi:2-polyprenyl-3-methyl-5-hydroxy-6-metoxy-1,4-benzoquinol methylase